MNKISRNKDKTVVKNLIKVFTYSIFLYSSSAWSEKSEKSILDKLIDNRDNSSISNEDYAERKRIDNAREDELRKKDSCKSAADEIRKERKIIADACKEAALGGTETCIAKTNACGEAAGADSYDSIGAFAKVLGVPSEITSAFDPALSKACPLMSGKDYFTEKKDLERDLKDTEEELAELNDKKAEIKNDYDKEVIDITESLTKAQEELKEKRNNLSKESRERIAEFNNTQNRAKEELRTRGTEILRLRGQLIQSQQDKALKLLAMTEEAGKRACMEAVNNAKKTYDSAPAGRSAKLIEQANKKRQDLINIYKSCMSTFDRQRIALYASKRQEEAELNKQIDNAQSSMDEIENTLNLADTQLKEIKESSTKEEADAIQSVVDLGTRNQEKMKAAFEKMQQNMQTLAAKEQSLRAALNRTQNHINELGIPPERGSTSSAREVASSISSALENIEDLKRDYDYCTNLEPKSATTTSNNNKKKRGSSPTGAVKGSN